MADGTVSAAYLRDIVRTYRNYKALGEKAIAQIQRDAEFEMTERVSREDLLRWWDGAWAITLSTLDGLKPEDLERTIHIRGEAFLAIEALNRNATHTAYHVGQIVYLARHFAAPDWKSLSIPKGKSAEFAKGDFKTQGIARTNQ